MKNDPQLVAAARELRDRWLEHVAANPDALLAAAGGGKYDVSRALPAPRAKKPAPLPSSLLVAA